MSTELTYEEARDNLAAYALGILEPDELASMERALGEHESLLLELEESDEAVVALAHATAGRDGPSSHVRSAVLSQARADARQRADTTAQHHVPPTLHTVATEPSAPPTRQRSSRWRWATLAAAACLMLALLYSLRLQSQLSTLSAEVESQQAQLATLEDDLSESQARADTLEDERALLKNERAALEEERNQLASQLEEGQARVATLQTELAGSQAELDELQQTNEQLQVQLSQQDEQLAVISTVRQVVSLPGTEEAPDASAVFYEGADGGLLVWNGLDTLPEDKAYQIWLMPAEGDPRPGGIFTVEADGDTRTTVELPSDRSYAAVAVSVEPASGSEVASGPILLLGEVTTSNQQS